MTLEDALSLQSSQRLEPDERTDQVRGRLDAVLIAARVAPVTRGVGLVPTAITTHTEPFHLSKAIATLAFVSSGRAGVRVRVSASAHEAAHFGRHELPSLSLAELFDEAADYVEVLRRLWAAGKTTRRSATSRPAGSWTATSCTTSISPVPGSASGARRSRRAHRRVSRS